MAVVQYGTLVTEIKGKVGGNVFQRCGQSLSLRVKGGKRQSNGNRTLTAKNQMALLASEWRSLSGAEYATWKDNAASYPAVDRYGNTIVLSPYQLFVQLNRVLQIIGEPLVRVCDAYNPPLIGDDNIGPYVSGSDSCLYNTSVSLAAGFFIIIYVSQPKRYLESGGWQKYRYACLITNADANGTNIFDRLQAAFNQAPQYGQWWFAKLLLVEATSGQSSLIGHFAMFTN